MFFAQPDVMKIHTRTITVNYNTGYKITLQEQNTSGFARETTAFAIAKKKKFKASLLTATPTKPTVATVRVLKYS